MDCRSNRPTFMLAPHLPSALAVALVTLVTAVGCGGSWDGMKEDRAAGKGSTHVYPGACAQHAAAIVRAVEEISFEVSSNHLTGNADGKGELFARHYTQGFTAEQRLAIWTESSGASCRITAYAISKGLSSQPSQPWAASFFQSFHPAP